MNKKILKLLAYLFLMSCVFAAQDSMRGLVGARLSQANNTTRIIFEFESNFNYKAFALKHPDRVVIDLPYVALKTNLNDLPISKSIVKKIRSARYRSNKLRIVLDLKSEARIKTFALSPRGTYSYRLVVDMTGKYQHPKKKKEPVYMTEDKLKGKFTEGRNIIVVVDPGHGGKDPGATGPRGIHEKHVVLAISKDLQRDIDKIPGMTAKLTRSGDYYITLRDRLRIARKDKADFFVAIHADSFHDRTASGASVFALSQRGATSEAARWLAEKENYSELGGVYLANKSRELRSVLIDLSQTATIRQSLTAGNDIVSDLEKITPMHSTRVEQARFVVLKSPDIPSLLVETGFITNPKEEHLLNSSWYRNKLAKAITEGIQEYFLVHTPPNTLLGLLKNAKRHTVRSGDYLAGIAKHYETNINIIKRMNHLKSDIIYKGEVLLVPGQATT